MPLPLNVPKRGLSLDEASEYCGVSRNTLTRHGPVPIKIGERTIYDRRALDRWLDQLAGLTASPVNSDAPEDALMEAIHARKAAVRNAAS
jgi:hypothetical protein